MSNKNKQIKQAIVKKAVEKKVEEKPKMRQIIIETDGTNIEIVKADTAGNLELVAILQSCLGFLTSPKK